MRFKHIIVTLKSRQGAFIYLCVYVIERVCICGGIGVDVHIKIALGPCLRIYGKSDARRVNRCKQGSTRLLYERAL